MEFPQQFPSLTIPTGAGPGQRRITINDQQNGKIQVYDASGNLVDSLGGPQGQFILYDASGNMVVSLASATGTDSKTGLPFQAGITTYTATTAINLFQNDITLTASDGSKMVLESGNGAAIFFTPNGGPWFAGEVTTSGGGGNHPGITLSSPSDTLNGSASSITFEGSSTGSNTTIALLQATTFNANAICSFGNIAVGSTVITPSAANTPTKGTVTFSTLVGATAHGFAMPQTATPDVTISVNNITHTTMDIWIERPSTTAVGIYYIVWYT